MHQDPAIASQAAQHAFESLLHGSAPPLYFCFHCTIGGKLTHALLQGATLKVTRQQGR
jgi:hypothetical protein